jgi:uncharacterized protein with von Willebrand factor type A (vWA) domain
MVVKVRPLSRQEILSLAVTDADAFTANRFLRHREVVPAIPEIEEKGKAQLPGIEGALLDLYHALWNPEPGVKEEVSPDRRYWRELLGQAMQSSAYGELHGQTQLRELQSILGTVSMGESVIAMVPKEDQEKLNELAQAQKDANDMSEQAQKAEANANAAQQLASAAAEAMADKDATAQQAGGSASAPQGASADKQGQPSGQAGGMTPEEAKAIANQLAEQAAKAKQDAQAANQLANEARAKAEQLADELMGKPGSKGAEEKLRELARIGLQAAKNAQAKVEEVSSTIEAWGLEEGELCRKSIPEALGLLERMKRNANLKKFTALLGRIRKIAARKAKAKIAGEGARVTVPETGRDLKRAHPSELVALIHPALRVKALMRWTRGELRLFGQKVRQKLGHGPVIVCEDGSGSMEGTKQQWAKAVTLSLAYYAKLQRRSFGWVHFGAAFTKLVDRVYPQGRLSPEQMLELAETFRNASGTDFEKPLRRAVEMIRNEGLKKADICLITDGECAVSDEFLREFAAAKNALEFNVITVLCDVGSSADATVRQFSDRVEKVSAFSAEEAEAKVFGHF